MFEATLRNRSQLELGSLTISFPIPEERYENVIFALKNLQIGDAGKQDCCIDSIHAPPLRSHPDPPPTIQCSWYPYEGQCPYMRLALICWRGNGECTFTDMQKIENRGEKLV